MGLPKRSNSLASRPYSSHAAAPRHVHANARAGRAGTAHANHSGAANSDSGAAHAGADAAHSHADASHAGADAARLADVHACQSGAASHA